jgi:hypothetical protein
VPPGDAERGIATIERALASDGPLTAEKLRTRVAAANVRAEGQALYHMLFQASLRGLIVRGPVLDGKHAYVLVRDWLGEPQPVDRDRALAELGRRYLAGHGPADERDLARWAGIGLRDARAALAAAGEPKAPREPELPPPKLLGAFDPVLLGWTSRDAIVGEHRQLVTSNGVFRPFVLAGGRAVAGWTLRGGRVELQPFGRLGRADAAAVDSEAQDVVRFLTIG